MTTPRPLTVDRADAGVLRSRLMVHVEQTPSGCWVWTGARSKDGYGRVCGVNLSGQRQIFAHRLSWAIANGPIPDGMLVLHRCDRKLCIRPTHIYLGDDADNARDREARRTGPRAWPRPQTHCQRGHAYRRRTSSGRPVCPECDAITRAKRRHDHEASR